MRRCHYCGWRNDDAAEVCQACGSQGCEAKPDSVIGQQEMGPETVAPPAVVEKKGAMVTLKCRTPAEAFLVIQELEREDILAILPNEEDLLEEFKRKGYVEMQVSAKAYEATSELRSVVEFRHHLPSAEEPLSHRGKMLASALGVLFVPGLLIYTWLRSNYLANGYEKMAREFRTWFYLGVLSWVIVFGLFVCFFT